MMRPAACYIEGTGAGVRSKQVIKWHDDVAKTKSKKDGAFCLVFLFPLVAAHRSRLSIAVKIIKYTSSITFASSSHKYGGFLQRFLSESLTRLILLFAPNIASAS